MPAGIMSVRKPVKRNPEIKTIVIMASSSKDDEVGLKIAASST